MPETLELVLEALIWATASTIITQLVGFVVMWRLGLPPKKLIHEIEDVQNPAVGAVFFVIALITATFLGGVTVDPTPGQSTLEDLAWIFGGIAFATIYTMISFTIAHRMMGRIEGETVYTYLRRELITEQNASLAFFFGALAVAPFFAILSQIL